MNSFRRFLFFIFSLIYLTACQKEITDPSITNNPGGGSGSGTGTGGSNNNASCNSTVMKLKKWQALFDDSDYISATWNTDGTIHSIRYNQPFSEYRSATYVYQNGRISQAILFENSTDQVFDTALYHYNAAGLVDSMYLKNNNSFDVSLRYANGKLTKYMGYYGGALDFYWDLQTDGNGNVIKGTEWYKTSGADEKQSIYTYTRDDKKSPFKDLAPYMFYLNDPYEIFRFFGPNNYTDQRFQDFTGTGIDMTAGLKFKYNTNCYPNTAQMTVMGQVVFTDDDYQFSYY